MEVLSEAVVTGSQSEMADEDESETVLEHLIKCCHSSSAIDRLMALLDDLYLVGGFTHEIIRVYSKHLLHTPIADENRGLKAFVREVSSKCWHKFLQSLGGQSSHFTTDKNCKFFISYNIEQQNAFS